MIHFSAAELAPKQNYKFLTGAVSPRPIAWITTQSKNSGVVNLAPFSFFTVVSSDLPYVLIATTRKDGQKKDTARNLSQTKEGVIHIVDENVLHQMNETAANLKPDESELSLSNLTTIKSQSVTPPGLSDPLIRLEVTLQQEISLSDDTGTIVSDLFILKVLDYYFSEKIFDVDKEYILSEKLRPVARLAGNNYALFGELFTLIRPQ
ncbi:flavin reductase family protein [Enterococcus dispar]|uniref:flavin reductase family protein n=1 Tax=Enterococcus dispar TaxID=44009 RepID=UPI00189D7F11|nr:flavin reductase family protein [Enterococcus dispar]